MKIPRPFFIIILISIAIGTGELILWRAHLNIAKQNKPVEQKVEKLPSAITKKPVELTPGTENWLTYAYVSNPSLPRFSYSIRHPKDWTASNHFGGIGLNPSNFARTDSTGDAILFRDNPTYFDKYFCIGASGAYGRYCIISDLPIAEGFSVPLAVEEFTTESGGKGYKTIWLLDTIRGPNGWQQGFAVSYPIAYLEVKGKLKIPPGTPTNGIEYVTVELNNLAHSDIFDEMIRTFKVETFPAPTP